MRFSTFSFRTYAHFKAIQELENVRTHLANAAVPCHTIPTSRERPLGDKGSCTETFVWIYQRSVWQLRSGGSPFYYKCTPFLASHKKPYYEASAGPSALSFLARLKDWIRQAEDRPLEQGEEKTQEYTQEFSSTLTCKKTHSDSLAYQSWAVSVREDGGIHILAWVWFIDGGQTAMGGFCFTLERFPSWCTSDFNITDTFRPNVKS